MPVPLVKNSADAPSLIRLEALLTSLELSTGSFKLGNASSSVDVRRALHPFELYLAMKALPSSLATPA